MLNLTPEQHGWLALLPRIARLLTDEGRALRRRHARMDARLLALETQLTQITEIERIIFAMSAALDQKLDELNTKADQVIDLLNTDHTSLAALQAANDALKTQQGDDSPQVAKAQAIIDKLTAAATPTPPETTVTLAAPVAVGDTIQLPSVPTDPASPLADHTVTDVQADGTVTAVGPSGEVIAAPADPATGGTGGSAGSGDQGGPDLSKPVVGAAEPGA